jgi:hypothetical protein
MTSPAPTLLAHDVASFRERGYLAIPAISGQDEVRWLREAYDEILADPRAFAVRFEGAGNDGIEGQITQVFLPERQCPKLLETAYLAHGRRLAAELLALPLEAARFAGVMLIYKPARGGRDTPWHQDEVYWEWPAERCHSLSVWMPLDPVTVDSGCMQFLPGSHRMDVLRYRQPPGHVPLVLDEPVDLSAAVACPLAAGGATFHHCRTLHSSGPNTSERPRRALSAIFHGPRTPRERPLVYPRPWRGQPD